MAFNIKLIKQLQEGKIVRDYSNNGKINKIMKKLILLAIIALGMNSCNTIFGNQVKVIEVTTNGHNCRYTIDSWGINIEIYDICGKWNVGDTIKLAK